ncbi:MAG: stage III sporulation protein AF [Gorillibacterium sp.]|nr:stage III sporulation protein AF [Gorillibacterium sp.]
MQWLSGWLKEIIVVILIASFADLLLPNKTMQRYVKTVIGLFLLMLLLSPVLRLFQMKWDTDKLMQAIDSQQNTSVFGQNSDTQAVNNMSSLNVILQEGERLKAADDASARTLVEERLAESVRTGVESRFDEQVVQVKVTTAIDKEQKLFVKSVVLLLAAHSSAKEEEGSSIAAIAPILPIAQMTPVAMIDNDEILQSQAAQEAAIQSELDQAQEAENPTAISAFIRDQWQIDPGSIEVKRETTQ